MKNINGNKMKVTAAGYVYRNGVKVVDCVATPISLSVFISVLSKPELDYVKAITSRRWTMC